MIVEINILTFIFFVLCFNFIYLCRLFLNGNFGGVVVVCIPEALLLLAKIFGMLKYAYVRRVGGTGGSSLGGCKKIPVGTVVMKRGRFWMVSPLLL